MLYTTAVDNYLNMNIVCTGAIYAPKDIMVLNTVVTDAPRIVKRVNTGASRVQTNIILSCNQKVVINFV